MKKIISLIISAALITTFPLPYVSAEDNNVILIEGESVTADNFSTESDSSYSGGSALKLETGTTVAAGGYTVSYTVTVDKAGVYSLETDSTIQGKKYKGGSGSAYTSPYYISINGSDNIDFDDNSGYNIGYTGTSMAEYKFDVYLNAGDNTVKFIVRDKRISDSYTYRFSLDCMKFTYTAGKTAYEEIKFEGENCTDSNGMTTAAYDTCSNGSEVQLITYNNTTIPVGGYYWKFPVYTAKAGMYSLEIGATRPGMAAGDPTSAGNASWISPWTFDVNGGEGVRFYGNSSCVNNIDGRASLDAKYNTKVYLDQGENTVTFHVNSGTKDAGIVVFTLDYFTLDLLQPMLDNPTVEAENYTQTNVSPQSGEAGIYSGKREWFQSSNENIDVRYDISAPEDSSYELYIMGSQLTVSWVSDYSITVNGSDEKSVTANDTFELNDMNKLGDGGLVRLFRLKIPVHLNKGHNSLEIRSTTKSANNYLVVLDYLKFVNGSADTAVSAEGYSSMNCHLAYNTKNYGNAEAYFYGNDHPSEKNMYVNYNFAVDFDGEYYMVIDIACSLVSGYTSPVGISVDDGELIPLTSDNTEFVSAAGNLSTDTYGRFRYKTPFALTAGGHKFHLESTGNAEKSNPAQIIVLYDGLKIQMSDTLAGVKAAAATSVLENGETSPLEVTPLGDTMTKYSGDCTLTYKSENEDIASVDANGIITSLNPGKATIKTTAVSESGKSFYCENDIYVTESSSPFVFISAAENEESGDVTVRLARSGSGNGAAKLICTHYGKENGVDTSVRSIAEEDVKEITNGNITEVILKPGEKEQGDITEILMWNGLDTMVPLWNSETL